MNCPAGKTSTGWTAVVEHWGNAAIMVKCSTKDCPRGDQLAQCIRSKKHDPRRTLTIRPQPQHQTLRVARHREATEAFQAEYARRAGVEATIPHRTRSLRLRRIRGIGPARAIEDTS